MTTPPLTADELVPPFAVDPLTFYPIVVGLVLVVQLMAFNGVGFYSSIRVLVAVALFSLVTSIVFRLVLGDRARSGVAAFLLMVDDRPRFAGLRRRSLPRDPVPGRPAGRAEGPPLLADDPGNPASVALVH